MKKILRGFLKAGANTRPVHYSDAASYSGLDSGTVRMNSRFLVSAGFLEPERRGYFKLTSRGTSFATALDWGNEEEAKRHLASLMASWDVGWKITSLVELSGSVRRDELLSKVAMSLGLKRSKEVARGLSIVIDELLYAGLLVEENDAIKCGKPSALPKPTPAIVETVEDLESLVDKAIEVFEKTPGIGRELIRGWIEYARRRQEGVT